MKLNYDDDENLFVLNVSDEVNYSSLEISNLLRHIDVSVKA